MSYFNAKFIVFIFLVAVALMIGIAMYNKKDGFCRCNSLGSRVICPDQEEANKKYVEGTLTENNF
jgi:hypothetical protein